MRSHTWRQLVLPVAAMIAVTFGIPGAVAAPGDARMPVAAAPASVRPWLPAGGIKAGYEGANIVGATVRESAPRSDGYRHVDTQRLVEKLRSLNVNTYVYLIWHPKDWDDLRNEFLPSARAAGIDVWVYLVPASECAQNCSYPFRTDFRAWAREIAQLSRVHPNLKAWAIDDFFSQVSREYVAEFTSIAKSINANLGFYITVYFGSAVSDAYLDTYGSFIDGLIYPFLDDPNNNTQVAGTVTNRMDDILAKLRPRNLGLVLLIYSGRFLDAARTPTATYVDEALGRALPYAADGRIHGVIAYGTPLEEAPALSSDNEAGWGNGRLSIALAHHTVTQAGNWAGASQTVAVNPAAPRYEITFWHNDQWNRTLGGYHFKQVLIDGQVIWEQDVADSPFNTWMQGGLLNHPIEVPTALLRGKTQATVTFRLFQRTAVGDYPVDVGFDNIESVGFTVRNPGFETTLDWRMERNTTRLLPSMAIYHADEPSRILQAIRSRFAG